MIKNITLELSLKPFKETTNEYIQAVCTKVFDSWKPLIKEADQISVMMWSADGSEILDYNKDMDAPFEWAYFVGGANNKEEKHTQYDPQGIGLHSTRYLYMENPPVMTYGILKKIILALKETGKAMFPDKKIRVGATFDPGPEFALSDFKYERHNEVCLGSDMGKGSMVCSYAVLNGDNHPYAAYPDGIPDGTPFGTFLGKQVQVFLTDMDFDYIWFSNGLGFGRDTWSSKGAIFDGENFSCDNLDDVKKNVKDFWTLFRNECPDFPIETRGTNMSLGIDMASDGVPLKDIYDGGYNLLPPPNSPWAALDGNFGLELMGMMSRIAEVPNDEYLIRYYIHDPWWINTPWYDRYNSLPHDIYLPFATSRIDKEGKVKTPSHFNILSIDNSRGDMPDSCVNEPMPHILKAMKEVPDDIAPFVWVYPFDEYSSCDTGEFAREIYGEDWYICNVINRGMPLSAVTSTKSFTCHNKEIYKNSVIVTPVPRNNAEFEKEIISYASNGGKVIFYGSLKNTSDEFRNFLKVKIAEEISGVLPITIDGTLQGDTMINPVFCGGGLTEEADGCKVVADVSGKVIACEGESFVWLRGINTCSVGGRHLVPDSEEKYVNSENLMLNVLDKFGYHINCIRPKDIKPPVTMLHKHNGAFIFSVFADCTAVETRLKLPLGAPILDGYDAKIEDGFAIYHFPKAERKECRVFVEQEDGIVSVKERCPVSNFYRRRIIVSGLKNATVRFVSENYCKNNTTCLINPKLNSDTLIVGDETNPKIVTEGNVTYYELTNVTGTVCFSMPNK